MTVGSPSRNPKGFLRDPFGRIPLSPPNYTPLKWSFVWQAKPGIELGRFLTHTVKI